MFLHKIIIVCNYFQLFIYAGSTSLEQGISLWAGYVEVEGKIVCGDYWDYNAASVLCLELHLGSPKEAFTSLRYGKPLKEYLSFTPICDGSELKLDYCKAMTIESTCQVPAGVVCSRVTRTEGGIISLDGFPVCGSRLSENAEKALCKEMGFFEVTKVEYDDQAADVSTGWSLTCSTENLDNCQKDSCIDGSSIKIQCGSQTEVKLVGGTEIGEGTILFNGGLVCDDKWDIKVRSILKEFLI